MNTALHVDDDRMAVRRNRQILKETLKLTAEPFWLEQVHSTKISDLDSPHVDRKADGSTTTSCRKTCVVMTADCLPVLLVDRAGRRITALHAGWRGLADGILENGVSMYSPDQDVIAWLGPAIGPDKFEVGEEVVAQLATGAIAGGDWYRPSHSAGKWLVDLYQVARQRLLNAGVTEVSGGGVCTFTDARRFYSYRRQGYCGRMATLLWIDPPGGAG
jgi:hypothetical protein